MPAVDEAAVPGCAHVCSQTPWVTPVSVRPSHHENPLRRGWVTSPGHTAGRGRGLAPGSKLSLALLPLTKDSLRDAHRCVPGAGRVFAWTVDLSFENPGAHSFLPRSWVQWFRDTGPHGPPRHTGLGCRRRAGGPVIGLAVCTAGAQVYSGCVDLSQEH